MRAYLYLSDCVSVKALEATQRNATRGGRLGKKRPIIALRESVLRCVEHPYRWTTRLKKARLLPYDYRSYES